MQPSLQGSVSPKSMSGSIWAKGDVQLQHMSSQNSSETSSKKGEHGVWSLQKSISATIRALNLIVFASLLFLQPIHTALSLCWICPVIWDFSFAATTFVVCWEDPQFKAHTEPWNQRGFCLKAKGKKLPWLLQSLSFLNYSKTLILKAFWLCLQEMYASILLCHVN